MNIKKIFTIGFVLFMIGVNIYFAWADMSNSQFELRGVTIDGNELMIKT